MTENVDYVFQKTAKNLLLSYSIISIMISTLSSFISQPSKIGKIANMQRVAIITLILNRVKNSALISRQSSDTSYVSVYRNISTVFVSYY